MDLFRKDGTGIFNCISEVSVMKMRILNVEPDNYNPVARKILLEIGELHEEACNRARLLELISEFDVLIVRLGHVIDNEVFQSGKRLKAVVTAATGLNHIDLEAASARGVEIISLKGESEFLETVTATAELTWALILSLIRHLPRAHFHVLKGQWNRYMFLGNELRNKSIGIVGYGRLGKIVAEYGRVFRMKVLVNDPNKDEVPSWVQKVSLEELLRKADIVSLHVNLDETTQGFFGREQIFSMKKGSVLVNTSRGEIIDEQALLEALESGVIAGAALDVLQGETSQKPDWLPRHPLLKYAQSHDNLILTPHIGGATYESMGNTELFIAEKLKSFFYQEYQNLQEQ